MRLEVEVQRKRLAAVLERAHEILLACVREFVPAHGKQKVQAQRERERDRGDGRKEGAECQTRVLPP